MNRIYLLLLFSLIATSLKGQDNSSTPDSGSGVLEAVLEKGIRLSDKAASTLEISVKKLEVGSPYRIPSSALVYYQDHVGVYRVRNGWYKLIEVELENKTAKAAIVRSKDLKPDDQIVVSGVALLRVAEMDAFGGEE